MQTQLTFDLGHRTAQGRNDFFVTGSNAAAVAWIDRWPDWSAPGLALWGPAASGKSHLAAVWRARSAAPTVLFDDLATSELPDLIGENRCLVIDARDTATVPPNLEEALLHLYNLVIERDGYLLLTARISPARWPVALADLSSRLRALASVAISPPDDDLLSAVLLKQFSDRQLPVGPDIVAFAVARMERSFQAANQLVDELDRLTLERKKTVGMQMVRDVIDRMEA